MNSCVIEHHLEGFAGDRCRWTPEHGLFVISALVEGTTPYEKFVEFYRIVHGPEKAFDIVYEK